MGEERMEEETLPRFIKPWLESWRERERRLALAGHSYVSFFDRNMRLRRRRHAVALAGHSYVSFLISPPHAVS